MPKNIPEVSKLPAIEKRKFYSEQQTPDLNDIVKYKNRYYIVGDPTFYIETPINHTGNLDSDVAYLYEMQEYATTSQSVENINIMAGNSEIFKTSCLEHNDCSLFLMIFQCF